MSNSSFRARRVASLAALSAVSALAAAASPALAGPTVTLKYQCEYPLVGQQPLSVVISSDIPSTVAAGTATNVFHVSAVASAGGDTRDGLKLLKVATIEGITNSTAAIAGPEANLDANVPITLPKQTIPAGTGDIVLNASGTTPALTFRKQGTNTITLKKIALNLIARKADGTAVTGLSAAQEIPATDNDPNTFDVSCALDPAFGTQSTLIGTIKVTAPTDSTPPTAPGTPTLGPTYTGTTTVKWTASTDAKGVVGYDVYDGDVRVVSTNGTTLTATAQYLGSNQAHSITVVARDAAGNVSAPSGAATTTTTAETPVVGTPNSTPLTPITLSYTCQYPLIGAMPLSAKITTNIPTSTYSGATLPKFNISTAATVPVETYDALGLVGVKSIEGAADAESSVRAPGFTLPITVPITVPKTAVPATRGPITLPATGTTPAIKFPKPGTAKIAVDTIALNLIARRADGTAIRLPSVGTDSDGNPDTFDVNCALNPTSQTGVIGTITLLKDTTAPTAPGTPVASAITRTTATVKWTASTDNAAVSSYDFTYNGVVKTLTQPITYLTGLAPNTTYTMTVKAKDAAGNTSPASATATFKTLP